MADIRRTIIAAVARNSTIGREGDMPWRLSSDLKRFKTLTMGKPVVMGRKTYDSIGKPLPGRPNIVISRQAAIDHPDISMAHSLTEAMEAAERLALQTGAGEICIIGGGQIYAQAIDLADRLCITHVEADLDGDAFFPAIDPNTWQAGEMVAVPAGERDSYPTRFVVYDRRRA
ncbi:dihydrofolate reductase [Rhizobium bangladeshense]|uniref:dihydrofolate reductase n=1 Tax=Rhizobium bangladeshense TaxID=1138189 RepID=UPI0007E57031|nr:dihydrofolate reductase [Rhizobium bangladeshense]MBX4888639.1 dihydrofolate reductase [Rhizobium bangladeshense]MBX4896700.1 dihydrofolate reductase [Rhizobium bangladeshense]MBX4900500.1 dihydrofolate reductase [Rhizobium bangladeshense]MBX4912701.1 dihydrofolate reductase [Rhizobium bangladeshense]MBX4919266.1 dihydrofolate reductase [Rhizobium bangladeshense]